MNIKPILPYSTTSFTNSEDKKTQRKKQFKKNMALRERLEDKTKFFDDTANICLLTGILMGGGMLPKKGATINNIGYGLIGLGAVSAVAGIIKRAIISNKVKEEIEHSYPAE